MTDETLKQAVTLAKNGNRREAAQLAKQYVRRSPKDPRGWWLIANLTSDSDIKRKSLERVVQLAPENAQAREMLNQLQAEELAQFTFGDSVPSPEPMVFSDTPAWALEEADEEEEEVDPFADVKPAKIPRKSSRVEIYAGIAMVILALLLVPLIGWYAYTYQHLGLFGLLGPDLSAETSTADYSLRYPGGWTVRRVGDARVEVASNGFQDWPNLADARSGDIGFENVDSLSGTVNLDLTEEVVLVIMEPVSDAMLQQIYTDSRIVTNSYQEYMKRGFESLENDLKQLRDAGQGIKYESGQEEIKIDGEPATLFYLTLEFESDNNEVGELRQGVYQASVEHAGTEYVFTLFAYGKNADSQKRLAQRILRTVEFLN